MKLAAYSLIIIVLLKLFEDTVDINRRRYVAIMSIMREEFMATRDIFHTVFVEKLAPPVRLLPRAEGQKWCHSLYGALVYYLHILCA